MSTTTLPNRISGNGNAMSPEVIEEVIIKGNLKALTPDQKVAYYRAVCDAAGLDSRLNPFEYITLQGKETLYAKKSCTEQLRNNRKININIVAREHVGDCYVVTARAMMPDGRSDESVGAVSIAGLKGDNLANALMKAETKAKRRVTLSICGLGLLDETELETIPAYRDQGEKQIPLKDRLKAAQGTQAEGLVAAVKENLGGEIVHLATEEQVREIKDLLSIVRLPEGTVDKWFAKAGCDGSWEDMPTEVVAKCIEHLKTRLPAVKK